MQINVHSSASFISLKKHILRQFLIQDGLKGSQKCCIQTKIYTADSRYLELAYLE